MESIINKCRDQEQELKHKMEVAKIRMKKLPNLSNPEEGQLFPNFDKVSSFDFNLNYREHLMRRLRNDTETKKKLTSDVKDFVSRMYRLDGTVTSISPGSDNKHIDEIDFNKAPSQQKYKFQRLRPDDWHDKHRKEMIARIID